MACVSQSLFVFFLLSYLLLLISADQGESYTHNCRPFTCKYLPENNIVFPFANITHPKCGLLTVACSNKTAMIQLDVTDGRQYQLTSLNRSRDHQLNDYVLGIRDQKLSENLSSGICKSITNSTIPHSSEFKPPNQFLTLFKCNHTADIGHKEFEPDGFQCKDNYKFYYQHPVARIPFGCSIIHLPSKPGSDPSHRIVTAEFELVMHVPPECSQCHEGEVQCDLDPENKFICAKEKEGKKREVLAIALGVGCSAIAIICLGFCMWRSCKKKHAFLWRNTYAVQSSRSDLEGGSTVYFGVHVFTYGELQEATNNFDEEKELGDGGFGTVYYGKLHDGREVAVKRLYEHNCRQVQQFINEVEILTRMRHKNLVSLYGCTSRRSRELLLVYEYIPNGTVADHIHGDRATPGSLPWPTRMNIAIETASALAYLHASEIIHRDVKTNNILLDDNFCVKVADFGLSRLFPIDVTHVSTGPQGTPGYVDPEYHQCYQLTKKSDVYSFGVVLIELISSLPAVDITRHRHEINLANLAINKIEQRAFHELIDPHLGFHSDDEVKSMTISVARLAFQCIQGGQELRPSMVEVLEALEGIQSGNDAGPLNLHPPPSPDCDQVGLLKKKQELPPSPTAVTDNWTSRSSTPNISG